MKSSFFNFYSLKAKITFSMIALIAGCVFTVVWPSYELKRNQTTENSDRIPAGIEGRKIYIREGCWYCHSQNVRAPEANKGLIRKPGDIGSETQNDYNKDLSPILWGTSRQGPDLSHVGSRLTGNEGRNWHKLHFKNPRSVSPQSIMPSYSYLNDDEIDQLIEYMMVLK